MENNNERQPLINITDAMNGTYKLKLIRPKFDKIKAWEDGTVSCRLFFVDDKGYCLSKSFGTKWTKPLAMLIGKFSSKFTDELRIDATPAEFMQYIEPACGKTCLVGVEATQSGEYNGKPQYKYKLTYPKGSQKPVVNDLPAPDDVPY